MTSVAVDQGLVAAYRAADAEMRRYAELRDAIRRQIETHLHQADADVGTVNGSDVVRWTRVVSRRLSPVLVVKRYGEEAVVDCYVVSETRRFTVIEESDGHPVDRL